MKNVEPCETCIYYGKDSAKCLYCDPPFNDYHTKKTDKKAMIDIAFTGGIIVLFLLCCACLGV